MTESFSAEKPDTRSFYLWYLKREQRSEAAWTDIFDHHVIKHITLEMESAFITKLHLKKEKELGNSFFVFFFPEDMFHLKVLPQCLLTGRKKRGTISSLFAAFQRNELSEKYPTAQDLLSAKASWLPREKIPVFSADQAAYQTAM